MFYYIFWILKFLRHKAFYFLCKYFLKKKVGDNRFLRKQGFWIFLQIINHLVTFSKENRNNVYDRYNTINRSIQFNATGFRK